MKKSFFEQDMAAAEIEVGNQSYEGSKRTFWTLVEKGHKKGKIGCKNWV